MLAELLRKRVTGDLGSLDPSIKNSSFLNSSATNKGTTRCWTDDLPYSFLAYHVSDRFNAETNNPTVTELGDSFRLDSCWLECSLVWSLWKLSNTHMCGLPSIRICTKVWGQMGDPLKKQHFFPYNSMMYCWNALAVRPSIFPKSCTKCVLAQGKPACHLRLDVWIRIRNGARQKIHRIIKGRCF